MEVIFLLVLFLNLADASDVTGPIEVCVSRDCIITAHNLLKNMNTTADPCEDFYEVTKNYYITMWSLSTSKKQAMRYLQVMAEKGL